MITVYGNAANVVASQEQRHYRTQAKEILY